MGQQQPGAPRADAGQAADDELGGAVGMLRLGVAGGDLAGAVALQVPRSTASRDSAPASALRLMPMPVAKGSPSTSHSTLA